MISGPGTTTKDNFYGFVFAIIAVLVFSFIIINIFDHAERSEPKYQIGETVKLVITGTQGTIIYTNCPRNLDKPCTYTVRFSEEILTYNIEEFEISRINPSF